MRKKLLLLLAAATQACFSWNLSGLIPKNYPIILNQIFPSVSLIPNYSKIPDDPMQGMEEMLRKENSLRAGVINKVLTTLQCVNEYKTEHNNVLTVIDYSLPSSEKRLWVFDLKEKKLLFHTYVSHGIKSGTLLTKYFSNKYDSKASSIGVYKTEQTYYGRDGFSLRLAGLERGFNDNASNRYVVMHGGWYVDEKFIKKYGRPGRSWGCPALPEDLTKPIISTIKDNTLFVVYYPSDAWFAKSKFLNCDKFSPTREAFVGKDLQPPLIDDEAREEVLFADINTNNKREENEPIVVISADTYQRIFQNPIPLGRMLRRQINNGEYIALSKVEFENIITRSNDMGGINSLFFVVPVIKMVRGYYATEMHFVNLGKIKEVRLNTNPPTMESPKSYTLLFENKPGVNLKFTNRFIRWLGL